MSAQWETYEQHCGRGRWVHNPDRPDSDVYVDEADAEPPGAGWEPFAAFGIEGDRCHGTHVIVWRRIRPTTEPLATVRRLKAAG